jgi:nucleotide-binding universal stress UspA family protein
VKILVALDFGDASREALVQARALSHQAGGVLAACHVLPSLADLSAFFPERALQNVEDTAPEDARVRKQLQEHARAELGLELTEVFVERGAAYAEIVRRAEEWGADRIVIGSHGRTGLARAVLGSVAERVVEHASCSVLIARPAPNPAPNPGVVMVATDLSDASLPAIRAGSEEAQRRGARLEVVSVFEWSPPIAISLTGLLGTLPALPSTEVQQQAREALRAMLEDAMVRAGAEGEARVLDGSPATEIVAHEEELRAELIVVATRGRTGLARLALGSVAERVIRSAGCSVLAVRAKSAATAKA